MDSLPEFGVFSPYTLFLHSDISKEPYPALLKRAIVLFNRLLFIPEGIRIFKDIKESQARVKYMNYVSHSDDINVLDRLSEIILLDSDVFENPEKLQKEILESRLEGREDDLWLNPATSENYCDFVRQLVNDILPKSSSISEKWEKQKYFIGNISYDYKLLTFLSKASPEFSGLYTELHEAAVLATLKETMVSDRTVISQIEEINHFDFAELSWQEILELRESDFADDFRKIVSEWVAEFSSSSSLIECQARLDRFIDDAKFDFIERNKPNLKKTVMGGILGNAPSPIVINPLGIASSIKRVHFESKLKKDFGWLLFINKARKSFNKE